MVNVMSAFRRPARHAVLAIAAISGMALLTGISAAAPAAALTGSAKAGSASSGSRLWVSFYSGPGAENDFANSVAVAPGGSAVFATGASPNAGED